MYTITYGKKIGKYTEKIPKQELIKIQARIEDLRKNPRPDGYKALKGKLSGYYRIRSGNYRIVYTINDNQLIITVIRIGMRGSIYD